jgi:hypothetical protein
VPWFLFQWTDDIIEHLAEHEISPEDFEYVVMNPSEQLKSRSSGRYAAYGYTPDGRWVFASYELLDESTVLPVTCFEPDED